MADALNSMIASRFDEVAMLLEQQESNPYRVAAYRQAADTLRDLDTPVNEILEKKGLKGLMELPGIGESLSRAIRSLVTTGRLPLLEQLRGESDPESLLTTLPGIGPGMAKRIHAQLGIESLEDLEAAVYDGRLRSVEGIGRKRMAGIRDVLARRLGRVRRVRGMQQPSVQELLDVDREYREKAKAGRLRKIAPRRFNPSGEAWLPVLHTSRGSCDYTALFSNTPRAHELNTTHDWVVIYCDDGARQLTYTVVTAQRGALQGLRVVRGREKECIEYYQAEGKVAKDN
jgi:DNA polymerase (family 10)